MNRRELVTTTLSGVAALTALGALPRDAEAKPRTFTPLAPGTHTVVPLGFDASKLTGLSEKLLTSHHVNNYAKAVENLNKVELELDKITSATPGFQVAALRERELNFANSTLLHERYFENLGGDGKATGAFAKALATQFGTAARWEEQLRATAMSLGGGSGWVTVAASQLTGDLRIVGTAGHTQALAHGEPILVLDMFEHAYAIDYGAAHAKYIDAFMANLRWGVLDKRWARALKHLP